MDPASWYALQRTAGNRAVTSLFATVQRCGDERRAGCPCVDEAPAVQTQPVGQGHVAQRFVDGTPDSPSADLPPGSQYVGMTADLLAMLGRTLVAKTYWHWVNTRPTNLGAALDALGPADLNTLVQLHRRLSAIGLWSSIQTIKSVWSTSSLGVSYNGSDMSAVVNSHRAFCKDTVVGESYHPGKLCWREMVTPGLPGLHVCMPGEVHIDPHQTVETTSGTGWRFGGRWGIELAPRCRYAIGAWFGHMADVEGGRAVNVFTRNDRLAARIGELRRRTEGFQQTHQSLATEVSSSLDAQRARLDALAPTLRRWAVQGFEGTDPTTETQRVLGELTAVEAEVDAAESRLDTARRSLEHDRF